MTWWIMLMLSLTMCAVFWYMIPREKQIQEVMQNGQLVPVEIVEIKEAAYKRNPSYWLYFQYDGQKHSIKIGYNFFNQINRKQQAQLLHLAAYPELFMAPDYDTNGQYKSLIALTCFFTVMVPLSAFKIYRTSKA